MAFLTIPLGIILVCAVGVLVIVWRKMGYLRKLTPESHEVGETLLHDYAPEAVGWFNSIPWNQYGHRIAMELETLLRRIRSAFAAVERGSDRLAQWARGAGQRAARQHERNVLKREKEREKQERPVETDPDAVDFDDPAQLKQEEQRLIVAIAQHPKDAKLYSDLARINMRLGNHGDAVEAMEQAVKLEPGNEAYAKRLERAKRRRDEAKKREEEAKQAVANQ